MNIINRAIAFYCIANTFLSFGAEQSAEPSKVTLVESKLLSEIRDGIFLGAGGLVLSGRGGTILCDVDKGKEQNISEKSYTQFVKHGNQIAGVGHNSIFIFNVRPGDEGHEEPWPLAHVALAFTNRELLVHSKGHFITPDGEVKHDGKSLVGISYFKNYEKNIYTIDCKNKASVPSLACYEGISDYHVIYPSNDKEFSVGYFTDTSVEEDYYVEIPNIRGLISGKMICSEDGSYIAITGTTDLSDGCELHLFDDINNKTVCYGKFNGCAINHHVMAVLRRNTAIDYYNLKTEDYCRTEPIIKDQELPQNCNFTIDFSYDGKSLFVVMPQGKSLSEVQYKAFMISVPAVVYAYNKAKAERK